MPIDIDHSQNDQNETIDRAVAGDQDAFGILYQENVRKIFSYIYYRTGSTAEAEDITARVFQRALKHIQSYHRTGVPFSAWLYRIAHNLVANWHRDNSRKKEIPLDGQDYEIQNVEHPETSMIKNQEIEVLVKVLHSLSPDRQLVIILKYLEDMSNLEIAQVMGRSEGAIKSLYHRTLLDLRDRFGVEKL